MKKRFNNTLIMLKKKKNNFSIKTQSLLAVCNLNLTGNDLKNLTEEFGSKNLDILKQKDGYPYGYMDSFKRFREKNCLIKNVFTAL